MKACRKVSGIVAVSMLIWVIGSFTQVGAVNSITLNPSSSIVGLTDIFTVDMVLNLDSPVSDLYSMGVYLKYDAGLLDVLDYDTGNWITDGTNILDGPYHNPFDLPGDLSFSNKNDANTPGEISWFISTGFNNPPVAVPAGSSIFATIKFQAKGTLGNTALTFYGTNSGGNKDTFVMRATEAQLLPDYSGSFVGGDVTVVPEPATLMLLGAGLLGLTGYVKKRKIKAES